MGIMVRALGLLFILGLIIQVAETSPGTFGLAAAVLILVPAGTYVLANPLILPSRRRLLAEKGVHFVETLDLSNAEALKQRLLSAAERVVCSPRDIHGFTKDVENTLIHAIALTKIQPHLATLRRKKAQNSYKDDYGIVHEGGWLNECEYFITRVLLPLDRSLPRFIRGKSSQYELLNDASNSSTVQLWTEFIDALVEFDNANTILTDITSMSGHDYEKFIGNLIEKCGWKALVTKGSGDQGADIIAERHGIRVVMQCKLYSSAVGNKAVQEVHAARTFYDCDHACVVSNADYTPSARKIAERTGVSLLHHDEIAKYLDDL